MGPMGEEDKNGMDYNESKLAAKLEFDFRSSKAYKHSFQNVNNMSLQILMSIALIKLKSFVHWSCMTLLGALHSARKGYH